MSELAKLLVRNRKSLMEDVGVVAPHVGQELFSADHKSFDPRLLVDVDALPLMPSALQALQWRECAVATSADLSHALDDADSEATDMSDEEDNDMVAAGMASSSRGVDVYGLKSALTRGDGKKVKPLVPADASIGFNVLDERASKSYLNARSKTQALIDAKFKEEPTLL